MKLKNALYIYVIKPLVRSDASTTFPDNKNGTTSGCHSGWYTYVHSVRLIPSTIVGANAILNHFLSPSYEYIHIIWFCSNWLAMSNSCYNPFIYGLLNVSVHIVK